MSSVTYYIAFTTLLLCSFAAQGSRRKISFGLLAYWPIGLLAYRPFDLLASAWPVCFDEMKKVAVRGALQPDEPEKTYPEPVRL